MPELLFPRYRDTIRRLDLAAIATPSQIPAAFLLAREGRYRTHYIPFESVNLGARLVVVGITPGFVQWKNAMREAQLQLAAGAPDDMLLRAARQAGAFSGAIRPNFVALLDAIGVQRWLGIASCASLFGADAGLVQVSAVLRHPVFVDGKNYSGSPPMARHGFLREQVLRWFAEEAAMLPDALYVPMGGSVGEALDWLAAEGAIRQDRILHGLPHPSGGECGAGGVFLGEEGQNNSVFQDEWGADRCGARKADAADGRTCRVGGSPAHAVNYTMRKRVSSISTLLERVGGKQSTGLFPPAHPTR